MKTILAEDGEMVCRTSFTPLSPLNASGALKRLFMVALSMLSKDGARVVERMYTKRNIEEAESATEREEMKRVREKGGETP